MKNYAILLIVILAIVGCFFYVYDLLGKGCFIGAFLADTPRAEQIREFKEAYGKKPYWIMIFLDWGSFIDKESIRDVYDSGSVLLITWEPWNGKTKQGIEYTQVLQGKWDSYIQQFACQLRDIGKPVFIRFAHEMNGNWYPWSAEKIGQEQYVALYRYVKNMCDKTGAVNTRWVFAVNWEDVPSEQNHWYACYPGNQYVDYVGIDGYNWGTTQHWSKWMSFREIFFPMYTQIQQYAYKPIIITEMGCTSQGGNKSQWIREALSAMKGMRHVVGFVYFNVDKETDWSISFHSDAGKEFTYQIATSYFKEVSR